MFQSCGRNQSEEITSLRVKLFRLFASEGEKFGEGISDINYFNNSKRIETVITAKDTDLGYFNMIYFDDNLKEISEKTRRDKN